MTEYRNNFKADIQSHWFLAGTLNVNYHFGDSFFFGLSGDVEFTDQGSVVRKFNLGNLKIGDVDFRAVKYIVELAARGPAGMGWLPVAVGIFQTGGRQKQLQFPVAP